MTESVNLKSAAKILNALKYNKLFAYRPYPKQVEFHNNGGSARERCFLAANQSGKTLSCAMEAAMHATGKYPEWWEGRRFTGPTRGWVCGTSAEGTRDTVQRLLLGAGTDYGTGSIPRSSIIEVKQARTVTGAVGQIYVKHVSGGTSYIGVRTYEQPLDRWAGESLDWAWLDEEPPQKHYSEGLTRLNARDGIAFTSLTPLKGMTPYVKLFYPHPSTLDRKLTMMTIDDVGHYTENQKAQIIASYPPHEAEARVRGIPMLGSGRVFPVSRASITCPAFEIPDHWGMLGGIDFGWDHPTGMVATAWDKDSDTIYVTNCNKERERTPSQSAVTMKGWYQNSLYWAWPHDGNKVGDRGTKDSEADLYRKEGVKMLPTHSTFENGGHQLEAGIFDMLQRMHDGRLKVFDHLEPWLTEFDSYHRKDGLIVKEGDDLMSSTRMAVMGKRFSRQRVRNHNFPKDSGGAYDPFGAAA